MFDLGELSRRLVKYLIEGLFVALAAYTIPKRSLNIEGNSFNRFNCDRYICHFRYLLA